MFELLAQAASALERHVPLSARIVALVEPANAENSLPSAVSAALDEFEIRSAALGKSAEDVLALDEDADRFQRATTYAELAAELVKWSDTTAELANALNAVAAAGIDGLDLTERLLGSALVSCSSKAAAALTLAGLLDWRDAGAAMMPRLLLDRISDFLRDPLDVVKKTSGWGSADYDFETPAVLLASRSRLADADLRFIDGEPILNIGPFTLSTDLTPLGIASWIAMAEHSIDLEGLVETQSRGVTFYSQASLSLQAGLAIRIDPPLQVEVDSEGTGTTAEGHFTTGLSWPLPDAKPGSLFQLGPIGAEVDELRAWLAAIFPASGPPDLQIGLSLTGLAPSISPSAGDGFISTLLAGVRPKGSTDLQLVWEPRTGLQFDGEGDIVFRKDARTDLGPFSLTATQFRFAVTDNGLAFDTRLNLEAQLGPISATIEELGTGIEITVSQTGAGTIGPLAFNTTFLPPRGVGLAIDAGPVTGGGYLFFDFEKAEYAGVLDLDIGEIGVTAIGLLTTRLPDGEDGFSLVLIITAEFPPIQLGFGFTLDGLGGLLGVNRGTDVDVLREGVRAGTIGSIMFPENPVENAPRIVSDIGRAFPPVRGQYVFGPMAMLGWGTPALLRAELGVLLELDSPLRLIILGQLHAGMPSLDIEPRLVDVHMDVLGIIDFDRQEASVDAALFDSRISIYALSGEMAMRLRWGEQPFFTLSIGGVHPAFPRPPQLPELRRLSLSLGSGNNPRFRLETYLAVTSNTVQVGALLDLYAAAAGFSVSGQLGFDALFEFSPFTFRIDMRASVALKRGSDSLFSVSLRFTLSGPSPWRAAGTATVSVFLIDVEIPFDAEFGSAKQPELPEGDPRSALLAALADPANWQAELPETLRVRLTKRDDAAHKLVHPAGALGVRQTVLPLGLELERFGNMAVGEDKLFVIDAVTVGEGAHSHTIHPTDTLKEHFAPASYLELTEAEKLAFPSFERMAAGVAALGSEKLEGAPQSGQATKSLDTITILFDRESDGSAREAAAGAHALDANTLAKSTGLGAAARARAQRGRHGRFATSERGIGISDERWAIVTRDTLDRVPREGLPTRQIRPIPELGDPQAETHSGAVVALRAHLRRNPADTSRLQIVAEHELVAA